MKAKGKGLQKLTETQKKIDLLLQNKKITKADLEEVNNEERVMLGQQLTDKLCNLKGFERDEFINKIEDILPADTKNQIWETNHMNITRAISQYMEDYGKMPGKNQIAEETGLSRQTIHKHLKDYDSHPLYAEEMKKFRFMADRVLSKTFKLAIAGDTKAARLYFEVLGLLGVEKSKTTIKTQNNYIQINDKVIRQESLKSLNSEQLQLIENILNAAMLNEQIT